MEFGACSRTHALDFNPEFLTSRILDFYGLVSLKIEVEANETDEPPILYVY